MNHKIPIKQFKNNNKFLLYGYTYHLFPYCFYILLYSFYHCTKLCNIYSSKTTHFFITLYSTHKTLLVLFNTFCDKTGKYLQNKNQRDNYVTHLEQRNVMIYVSKQYRVFHDFKA